MVKIAFFNQKGGTAKTTSAFNIAGILAKNFKKKVLIVDGDPQANSSKALLLEDVNIWNEEHPEEEFFDNNPTIVEVLNGKNDVNEAIYKAHVKVRENSRGLWRGIDVLPTKRSMSAVDIKSDYDIKSMIESIRRTQKRPYNYDFIIFDCPPYLSDLTINILAASDFVMVPASTDMDSLDGFNELLETIEGLKQTGTNTHLEVLGIYLTMIKLTEAFDKYVYEECRDSIGDKFISMPIRRDTAAKQASSIGVPLCWYKKTSNSAKDYVLLTKEILKRLNMLSADEVLQNDEEIHTFLEKYKIEER